MNSWRVIFYIFFIKLDQIDKYLYEYTREFNSSFFYWKDDISVKATSYMYNGGLKVVALRVDLMTNWQASKHTSYIALQNDAAKNILWRSIAVNIPRSGNSGTTHNKGKAPMPMPSYKRPRGNIGHNNHGNYGCFKNNGSKGASCSKVSWPFKR
jgi:hypothetical protein